MGVALGQSRLNRLWDAVQRTSSELVWEMTPDGAFGYLSEAAHAILGVPAEELPGRRAVEFVHPDDRERVAGTFLECRESRAGWEKVRFRVVKPDGGHTWVETSGVAHVGKSGSLLGFTATTRRLDATEIQDVEREETAGRIRQVLEDRHLVTVWQPIFSMSDGRIAGVEALSRFAHPLQQPPDIWFAQAAEVGLGAALDVLAFEAALRSAETLPNGVYLSINASPGVVSSGALLPTLLHSGLSPDRVVIELTEHVSVEDYGGLVVPLNDLRAEGVRLAVDDAGAGFASFRHILRLDPDIIKLDRSIVQGITTNPAQRALATALVLFALEAGPMQVVAEGVENADDLSTVSLLGIDAAQGFFMSEPLPPTAVDWSTVISHDWT